MTWRTLFLVISLTFTEIVLIGWVSLLREGTAFRWMANPSVYLGLRSIGQSVSSPIVQQGSPYEDLGVFGIVALVSAASFLRLSFRQAVSVICLLCIELSLAIMFFDFGEFFKQVTNFQVRYDIIPWFTNADLLIASTIVLLATLFWSATYIDSYIE